MVSVPKRRKPKCVWGLPRALALLGATSISITTGLHPSTSCARPCRLKARGRQRTASVERYLGLAPPYAGGCCQRSNYRYFLKFPEFWPEHGPSPHHARLSLASTLGLGVGRSGMAIGDCFILLFPSWRSSSFYFQVRFRQHVTSPLPILRSQ